MPDNDPLLIRFEKSFVTRGQYLFAEPLYDGKAQVLEDSAQVEAAINSKAHMVISVPMTASRKHINDYLKEVLGESHPAFSNDIELNPETSNALYKPSIAPRIKSLKTLFDLYDLNSKGQMTQYEMAEELTIVSKVKPDPQTGKVDIPEQMARTNEKISRRLKEADLAIKNAGRGVFP